MHIYFACLGVCLFVSNKSQNGSQPNGPKFCVAPNMAPGKVYVWSKFQISASNKIWFFKKIRNAQTFFFLFNNVNKEKMIFSIEIEDGRETPWKRSITLYFLKLGI